MINLVVSINDNNLKISYLKENTFVSASEEIPEDIANDYKILDAARFGEILKNTINGIFGGNHKKAKLNFVVEPDSLIFKFITLSKSSNGIEHELTAEIEKKIPEASAEDMYFSTVKIAPFVYQFVGAPKAFIESYLEVATASGFELGTLMPWPLLLPKYIGTGVSAIYVCKTGKSPVVLLSELGGVFFVGSYEENKSPEELAKLVQGLSVYKRVKPIEKVYTFGYDELKMDLNMAADRVQIPHLDEENTKGFEHNLLAHYMLDLVPDVMTTQTNLLNMLPLPVKNEKAALVPVGAALSAILVAGLLFGGFRYFSARNASLSTPNDESNMEVLSGTTVVGESLPQDNQQPMDDAKAQDSEAETNLDLPKDVIVISVENGSGYNGIAAKTRDFLEGEGYRVLSIDTADVQQTATTLKFKQSVSQYQALLQEDLKEFYPDIEVSADLPEDSEYDLLITVGSSVTL